MRAIKVGLHREKGRIWLEGNWLAAMGFARGTSYVATIGDGEIVIQVAHADTLRAEDKLRKVSGKGDRPIIDMNSSALLPFVGPATLINPTQGLIIIKKGVA